MQVLHIGENLGIRKSLAEPIDFEGLALTAEGKNQTPSLPKTRGPRKP